MAQSIYDTVYLEPEQQELLAWMVEVHRELPREKRDAFLLLGTSGGDLLLHPDIRERPWVNRSDLDTLAERGLLRRGVASKGSPRYDITPEGRRYYEELQRHRGQPVEVIEGTVQRFLDGDRFRAVHPASYNRWREAEQKLWGADSAGEFTEIGHICREAMQRFATELVETHRPPDPPADVAKTVARIEAVLRHAIGGDRLRAFLAALVALAHWGTLSDLVMRQEHGAQKDGEPLTPEDARRVVFQTAIAMFEISRALAE
jgi:hypothetical protein